MTPPKLRKFLDPDSSDEMDDRPQTADPDPSDERDARTQSPDHSSLQFPDPDSSDERVPRTESPDYSSLKFLDPDSSEERDGRPQSPDAEETPQQSQRPIRASKLAAKAAIEDLYTDTEDFPEPLAADTSSDTDDADRANNNKRKREEYADEDSDEEDVDDEDDDYYAISEPRHKSRRSATTVYANARMKTRYTDEEKNHFAWFVQEYPPNVSVHQEILYTKNRKIMFVLSGWGNPARTKHTRKAIQMWINNWRKKLLNDMVVRITTPQNHIGYEYDDEVEEPPFIDDYKALLVETREELQDAREEIEDISEALENYKDLYQNASSELQELKEVSKKDKMSICLMKWEWFGPNHPSFQPVIILPRLKVKKEDLEKSMIIDETMSEVEGNSQNNDEKMSEIEENIENNDSGSLDDMISRTGGLNIDTSLPEIDPDNPTNGILEMFRTLEPSSYSRTPAEQKREEVNPLWDGFQDNDGSKTPAQPTTAEDSPNEDDFLDEDNMPIFSNVTMNRNKPSSEKTEDINNNSDQLIEDLLLSSDDNNDMIVDKENVETSPLNRSSESSLPLKQSVSEEQIPTSNSGQVGGSPLVEVESDTNSSIDDEMKSSSGELSPKNTEPETTDNNDVSIQNVTVNITRLARSLLARQFVQMCNRQISHLPTLNSLTTDQPCTAAESGSSDTESNSQTETIHGSEIAPSSEEAKETCRYCNRTLPCRCDNTDSSDD